VVVIRIVAFLRRAVIGEDLLLMLSFLSYSMDYVQLHQGMIESMSSDLGLGFILIEIPALFEQDFFVSELPWRAIFDEVGRLIKLCSWSALKNINESLVWVWCVSVISRGYIPYLWITTWMNLMKSRKATRLCRFIMVHFFFSL